VSRSLLEVLRDVTLDPDEHAAFSADPAGYLAQFGYEDVPTEHLAEAFSLVADTLPADVAQNAAPAGFGSEAFGPAEGDLAGAGLADPGGAEGPGGLDEGVLGETTFGDVTNDFDDDAAGADTDHNGLDDAYEARDTAGADTDHNGLDDAFEARDTGVVDTDHDGLDDAFEAAARSLDPTTDTDQDGLDDDFETAATTPTDDGLDDDAQFGFGEGSAAAAGGGPAVPAADGLGDQIDDLDDGGFADPGAPQLDADVDAPDFGTGEGDSGYDGLDDGVDDGFGFTETGDDDGDIDIDDIGAF
jgi:hypothetical protein